MHAQIDLQATTGYKDFIFGGDATYDTAKQDVTKWATGVGMPHPIMPSIRYPHLETSEQSTLFIAATAERAPALRRHVRTGLGWTLYLSTHPGGASVHEAMQLGGVSLSGCILRFRWLTQKWACVCRLPAPGLRSRRPAEGQQDADCGVRAQRRCHPGRGR